ncbi:hypothetical protein K1T71_010151 [Dendrolimus kikuchii]|uniref:Uncharacterized protein n=1 Tax=Dendrolimus kikuchii TaxID=765133 RepID=A0ACC1CRG9_9NEOP|nr:hypothetical protein K1T71_010151 [Dendrolimus kikuchii]
MKFLVAFVAVVAVAVASPLKGNKPIISQSSELEAIIAAIQSPSTDPATAALLEQQLQDILGVKPEPEFVEYEPIAVGPEIVDFPLPDGGVVTAPEPAPVVVPTPVQPSPVVIGDLEAGQKPLVQIIVNVNTAAGASPAPAVVPEIIPQPVIVVDEDQNVESVNVVDNVEVDPVQVAEPVIVEPVVIGIPIIPEAAVVLPEELN